jgi:hypothetical protein
VNAFLYRHRVLLLHLAFWGVYISFFAYQVSSFRREEIGFLETLYRSGIHVGFNMLVAYLNYFILLPRFLENKKVGQYLVEFFIPFAILMVVRVYLQRYAVDGYTHQAKYFYSNTFVVQATATSLFVTLFVGMLRFAKDWFEFESTRKEAENARLVAELNFLKAQINPHFLFNTLNNIYYLAYSKSENTTEVIAKLSQMMRYMIYEGSQAEVLLDKELEYMQSYISLEQLRLNNQLIIDFEVKGQIEGLTVAPFILIPFLENAFKHGIHSSSTKNWINLSLVVEGTQCSLRVRNSKQPVALNGNSKSGIGLQNVKRRLELSYPNRHQLAIQDKSAEFDVQLQLTLTR